MYGCLFTCLTNCAVHIEDVSSLETDAFIQALRRFISNRGCRKEIWSDNGTANHLLLQQKNLALPPGLFVREHLYRRKQWRRAQFLADCFWKRSLREYVPALQQRQKWAREKGNLKVNDLVMLVDENSSRGRWLLGRVMKIFPGHDQRVRVGEVKTKNSTLVRPISKLVLLEEED